MVEIKPAPTTRSFLELTLVGEKPKTLYIPTGSVLTYEDVPEGKNPAFPQRGTFLRYDFGEGLAFAIVAQSIEQLKEEIGTEGFLQFTMMDDAEIYLRNGLIVAVQEKEDTDSNVTATQVSLNLNGQVGSIFIKDTYEEMKLQLTKC